MPLRAGPRHCGQSLADVDMETAEQNRQSVARVASKRDFKVVLLLGVVIMFRLAELGKCYGSI